MYTYILQQHGSFFLYVFTIVRQEWDNHKLPTFSYDISVTQVNGAELSNDRSGLFTLHIIASILSLIVFFSSLSVFDWRKVQAGGGGLHLFHMVLFISLSLNLFSNFMECIHLGYYSSTGQGLHIADALGEYAIALSQLLLSSLFVALGLGFSTTRGAVQWDQPLISGAMFSQSGGGGGGGGGGSSRALMGGGGGGGGSERFTLPPFVRYITARAVMTSLLVVTIVLVWVGRHLQSGGEGFEALHKLETTTGFTLLLLRVGTWALFAYGVHFITLPQLRREGNEKLSNVMGGGVFYLGSLYLLGFPIICVLASLFVTPYLRQRVVAMGALGSQFGAQLAFSWLFLGDSAFARESDVGKGGSGGIVEDVLKRKLRASSSGSSGGGGEGLFGGGGGSARGFGGEMRMRGGGGGMHQNSAGSQPMQAFRSGPSSQSNWQGPQSQPQPQHHQQQQQQPQQLYHHQQQQQQQQQQQPQPHRQHQQPQQHQSWQSSSQTTSHQSPRQSQQPQPSWSAGAATQRMNKKKHSD